MGPENLINYLEKRIQNPVLSLNEHAWTRCQLAKELEERGDYEGARAAIGDELWPRIGGRPVLEGLDQRTSAAVLLRTGTLAGWIGSAQRIAGAKETAQSLLGGSIAIFEMLGEPVRVAEAQIELAFCHWRDGSLDHCRQLLREAFERVPEYETDLRTIALVRCAIVERTAKRPKEAHQLMIEAMPNADLSTNVSLKGRFHNELATILKYLGETEGREDYITNALTQFDLARSYFEQLGHMRFCAVVENNIGFLHFKRGQFGEAHQHLDRARQLFESLKDDVHTAQVNETCARLLIAENRLAHAEWAIRESVDTLEKSGQQALLAEALTTQGLLAARTGRAQEARPILERAREIAEACGDREGAGRAALTIIEEMCDVLSDDDRREVWMRARQLLINITHPETITRLYNCEKRVVAAQAEYQRRREEAIQKEKLAALGELAYGVAHDFNNILTAIMGRAQMLQRTSDPFTLRRGLEIITRAAEDGAHTIKRIQDSARQRCDRDFALVGVDQLLEDVCEFTRPRWEDRAAGAEIQFALDIQNNSLVMGDAAELREVLVNMVYNAIHAMPAGGRITLGAEESGDKIVIAITDTGAGMSKEVQARIFDPFFTTKGKLGTGMGLSVSYGIITRHNGTIEVDSEADRGTVFFVTLPLASGTISEPVRNEFEATTPKLVRAIEPLRILVVDDEEYVCDLLRDSLEGEGYEVVTAADGREALDLFEVEHFDGVFTDIGMPRMDGWELAREVRQRSPEMPLAVITGWGETISAEKQRESEVNWVLTKPFELGRITEIVEEVAKMRVAQR